MVNGIALKQPSNASLEPVQANPQERARAMMEARPELDGYFEDRPAEGLPTLAGAAVWTARTVARVKARLAA